RCSRQGPRQRAAQPCDRRDILHRRQPSRPRDPRLPVQHVGSRHDEQKHRHACHAVDDRGGGDWCPRADGYDAPYYPD
ncbi:hypothetical protein ABTH79_19875, partial [Acinetobacter baumannii]